MQLQQATANHSKKVNLVISFVFVRVEKQKFGDAYFSGGEMILFHFFAVRSPDIRFLYRF